MKRVNEMAGEVTAYARRSRPAPPVEEGEDARDPHRCRAYGCPMPGAISESTTGGSAWFCRYHAGAEPMLWANITSALRNGTLGREEGGESPTVREMRQSVERARARRATPAPAAPSREPGEDG